MNLRLSARWRRLTKPHQPRNVLEALAQRRQHDREDVEPVVQVRAEAAPRHRRARSWWVAATMRTSTLRDCDDPRARTRLPAARAAAWPAHRRAVADLVEEERAAVGQLEPPLAHRDAPGEGAAHVAEQLGSISVAGSAAQFTLTNGRPRARCDCGSRAKQLLAGAGLAEEQHRRVGRGCSRRTREPPLHAPDRESENLIRSSSCICWARITMSTHVREVRGRRRPMRATASARLRPENARENWNRPGTAHGNRQRRLQVVARGVSRSARPGVRGLFGQPLEALRSRPSLPRRPAAARR